MAFGKSFKGEYSFANSYKANFIISEPTIANPQKSTSNTLKIFIGAKEVYPIDNYTEKEKIDRFDLSIDWGWFYFITKPLFFVIDYIFKIVGNFGVAIIILTLLVRILFFPLKSYQVVLPLLYDFLLAASSAKTNPFVTIFGE